MSKIFSATQAKTIDEYTINQEGISIIELIERAADEFVQTFRRNFSKQNRIITFAGPGNNGADALAVTRKLLLEGYNIHAYLVNPKWNLSLGCNTKKEELLELSNTSITELTSESELPLLSEDDIVIDGLLGTGLNRPVEGDFGTIIQYINNSEALIVSIDIPSGLMAEDNRKNTPETIIQADQTYTFAFPKLAFLLSENDCFVGKWKVLPVDLSNEAIEMTETTFYYIDEADVSDLIEPRSKFTSKGDYGHALLIAGSKGKMGAAILSAKATMRTGAGLLTVHTPKCGELAMQISVPEAMLSIDDNENYFSTLPEISRFDAIGIGPGLGVHLDSRRKMEQLLDKTEVPIVIDADAINILASDHDLFVLLPKEAIFTPHEKELDRIIGNSNNSLERIEKALDFAKEHQVYIIIKGAHTATCSPSGNVYFNSCGNPGMATAGSGDVLTGVILGLLSQGYSPCESCIIGVFLHATAGDISAQMQSEESLIASDITEMIGKAYKQIK